MDIQLHRTPLAEMRVEAIVAGASGAGELDASVLAAAGGGLLEAARGALDGSLRTIGEAVITPSFGLEARGILWIVHVVNVVGGRRPRQEKLRDGVRKALQLAAVKDARSIAFAMLGSGERAASHMLAGIRAYQGPPMDVHFALPAHREYAVVEHALRR